MKTLASVCAGIAVVASIVSVSLWRELRTERLANAALQTRLTAARIAIPANAVAVPVVASTMPVTATISTPADAPVCKPDTPSSKPAQPALASLVESLTRQNEMMKDPEYRKLRLAQARSSIERNYPGLAEELGLSEKEADRLFDLLAENQTALSADSLLLGLNGTEDRAATEERMRRQTAMRREQEDALRAVLGSKYPQYQNYQQTMPARSRVTSMNLQLAQMGLPLTDAQTRSLTSTMIAEQQRQTQEARAMSRTPVDPADPDARAKMLEEQLNRTEDSNRRMIEAAAPHLSAKQLAAYRQQMEQQAAMTRITMKMQMEQQRLQAQPKQ